MAEWRKVEDNIFKFDNKGDAVEGLLVAKETGALYGNDVYKIKLANGELMTIFSTTILSSKMSSVEIGDEVRIEYMGEAKASKAGQNPVKLFDVFVR